MYDFIDKGLLQKYDVRGPRYTSYPTALQFDERFTVKDYCWHLEHSNQDPIPKPLSLYLHIPFCQSLCYYCGCHKIVTQNESKVSRYIQTLHQEIVLQANLVSNDREVKQIHFGGGTPTYLDVKEIQLLLTKIKDNFNLAPEHQMEVGIEIDPRTTTPNDIQLLAEIGFNRMSFGVQDFAYDVQVAINRLQDEQETLKLIQTAQRSGIDSVSVDLIYGLPKQTANSFIKTIDKISEIKPDRIALYNYAHMPERVKAQKLIAEDSIPSADEKLSMFLESINKLLDMGYVHIGMDHFALPDDTLAIHLKDGRLRRNFQGYSTHNECDVIGFGVSAISTFGSAYSQNHKSLQKYESYIKNNIPAVQQGYALTKDDSIRAMVIEYIMCRQNIDFEVFSQNYYINFVEYFSDELECLRPMQIDGLLIIKGNQLVITQKGALFLRNIAMVFDRYLNYPQTEEKVLRFSKTL